MSEGQLVGYSCTDDGCARVFEEPQATLSNRTWGTVLVTAVLLMLAAATLGLLIGITVWAGWWALGLSVVGFLTAFVCGAIRD